MYNTDQKLKFISDRATSDSEIKMATALFEATQKFEQNANCDICYMKGVDLKKLLNDVTGLRLQSKHKRAYILRNYIKWCKDEGINDVSEDIFNIDVKNMGIDKFKRQTVANPCQLQMFLNLLFDDENEETVDCIYRCYCWLAFIGVKESDAMDLTNENVNMYTREVCSDGITHVICNEAVKAFDQCLNLSSFNYKNKNYNDKIVVKQRSYGDKILRGMSEEVNNATYRVELSRRQTYKRLRKGKAITPEIEELRLSYYRIQLSGIFYRAYEHERAGIKPEFMSVADYFIGDKEYKVPSSVKKGNERLYIQKQYAASYYEDYKKWKMAHSI